MTVLRGASEEERERMGEGAFIYSISRDTDFITRALKCRKCLVAAAAAAVA